MYLVHFTNFGYFAEQSFATIGGAVAHARKCCFDATIQCPTKNGIIAVFSTIGGLSWWDDSEQVAYESECKENALAGF